MLESLSRRREQERAEQQELIAHEIHDGACQYMVTAQMALDAFRRDNKKAWSGNWSKFDLGLEFVNHAIEELRRLIRGLQPIQLAAGNLPTAIAHLIQEIKAAGGPDIEFCHDIQTDHIPPRLELAAFRIVQESLANACRHSKSQRILVGLTRDDDSLCIQVQDWGTGFDPDNTPHGHYGLEGMRRRVKTLHGIVTIQSDLGGSMYHS